MSYGFASFNDQNIQQIDDLYSNYYLIADGTGVTNSTNAPTPFVNFTNNNYNKVVVNFTNTSGLLPLIFIKCNETTYANSNEFYFFSVELTSPTSFNILAISGYSTTGAYVYSGYRSASFSWRAYLPQSILSSSAINYGYGINIYNNSFNAVFSSNNTNIMKIYGNYDAYGSWQLVSDGSSYGVPASSGLFQEIINVGTNQSGENPWFLANQSATEQISIYTESGFQTFGVWIGTKNNSGTDYLCGWCETTARTLGGMNDVIVATGTTPQVTCFNPAEVYLSAYNSTTGQATLSTWFRDDTGPVSTANYPIGTEIVFGNISTNNFYGPYVVTNAVNGSSDIDMSIYINTGLSLPTGYTTRIYLTNKIGANSSLGYALMRIPGVTILKS